MLECDVYTSRSFTSRHTDYGLRQLCAEEREGVQKKTFTKWCNSHLERVNLHVDDLHIDLRDGKNLIKLLEILSGERLVRTTPLRLVPPSFFILYLLKRNTLI